MHACVALLTIHLCPEGERSVFVFMSARSWVKANFSGQFKHNHFSHLLATAHHEGFFF